MVKCNNPRDPFVGSGRRKQRGFLATHKQDFNSHIGGSAYRHCANQIDMEPVIPRFPGQDVQETLELISDAISQGGDTYVTIGDGNRSSGDFNVGDSITPTFEDAVSAALAEFRLSEGGIVLLKAGKYVVSQTITIPAGIKLMGEPSGVTIVGETSDEPIFSIEATDVAIDVGGSPTVSVDNPARTTFFNLIIFDNLDENQGTDPTLTSRPMIECNAGCNFIADKITLIGRVTDSFLKFSTYRAIGTTGSSPVSTRVTVRNSYIDAVQNPIFFTPLNGISDKLVVENSRISYLGASGDDSERSAISTTACTVKISNNTFFANNSDYFAQSAIYVSSIAVANVGQHTVVGNSGNLTDLSTDARPQFFINDSTQEYFGLSSGNTWGNKKTDWYITVGDGVSSTGDVVGERAFEIILKTFSTATAGLYTVVVNYGKYKVTLDSDTSKSFYPSVIGNFAYQSPDESDVPEIEIEQSGENVLNLGGDVRNVKFVSLDTNADVTFVTSPSIGVFKNCDFENCRVSADVISDFGNEEHFKLIENCNFKITSLNYSNRGAIESSTSGGLKIKDCFITGFGYGVLVENSEKLVIENCIMDSYNGDTYANLGPVINQLRNGAGSVSSYLYVSDCGEVEILNTRVQSVPDDIIDQASYNTIDLSIVEVDQFERYAAIYNTKKITVDGCQILSPGGEYVNTYNDELFGGTPVISAIVGLFIFDATEEVSLTNSDVRAQTPMQITGPNSFPQNGLSKAKIAINDNYIGAHDSDDVVNINITTMLGIDLTPYDPEYIQTRGSIDIRGNVFENRKVSTVSIYAKMYTIEDINSTFMQYGGGVNIHAVGWGVNFQDNDVSYHSRTDPLYAANLFTFGTGAVSIINGSFYALELQLLSDTTDAQCVFSGNKIKMLIGQYYDNGLTSADNVFSSTMFSSAELLVTDNVIRFDSINNLSTFNDTNEAMGSFIYVNGGAVPSTTISNFPVPQEGGVVISNNLFGHNRDGLPPNDPAFGINTPQNAVGNMNRAAIYIGEQSSQGQVCNNSFEWVFQNSATNVVQIEAQRNWSVYNNKNLQKSYNLRPIDHDSFFINPAALPSDNSPYRTLAEWNASFPNVSRFIFLADSVNEAAPAAVFNYVVGAGANLSWIIPISEFVKGSFNISEIFVNTRTNDPNDFTNFAGDGAGTATVSLYLIKKNLSNNVDDDIIDVTTELLSTTNNLSLDFADYINTGNFGFSGASEQPLYIALEIDATAINAAGISISSISVNGYS